MVTLGFDDEEQKKLAKLIAKLVTDEMRGNHPLLDGKLAIPNSKAAKLLSLNTWQLDQERKKGKIECVRGVGRRIFFTLAQIMKYLNENTERGN